MASPSAWRADPQPHMLGLVVPSTTTYPQTAGTGTDPDMNWLPANNDPDTQWTSILNLGLRPDMSVPTIEAARAGMPASASQMTAGADNGGKGQNPNRPAVTNSAASGLSGTPSTKGSGHSADRGRLYATSSSARATAYERDDVQSPFIAGAHAQVPISNLLQDDSPPQSTDTPYVSLIQGLTPPQTLNPASSKSIWPSTYESILRQFERFSGNVPESGLPTGSFPSIEQIDMVLHLFFDRFLPSLPIIHETLSGSNDFWILTLAMATIGCHYTKTEEFDEMVVPLHEFLRLVLQDEANKTREPAIELQYLLAFFLSQIGLTYYGPIDMRNKASLHYGSLIGRAESLGLFSPSSLQNENLGISTAQLSPESDIPTRWHSWVREETARRLGYAIWVCILPNTQRLH